MRARAKDAADREKTINSWTVCSNFAADCSARSAFPSVILRTTESMYPLRRTAWTALLRTAVLLSILWAWS